MHLYSRRSGEQKPPEQKSPADAAKETQKKIDEIAEAARLLTGPAGNPECVWLGRRVVSLLWRDDLDTAFRHLDLYDRFGCPSGHIQATFRCLVKQGNIDPKAQDSLNGRVHACWIDPTLPPTAAGCRAGPGSHQRNPRPLTTLVHEGEFFSIGMSVPRICHVRFLLESTP